MVGKLVSLVRGSSQQKNISTALNLIKPELANLKKAKRILIKPNLTAVFNQTANSSVVAVEAILDFLKDFDPLFTQKEIVVIESSGEALTRGMTMKKVFQRFGFDKISERYPNVTLKDLEEGSSFLEIPIETLSGVRKVRISKEILGFDYKISVALPKTHDTVIATLGVKNFLMGVIDPRDKHLMHGIDHGIGRSEDSSLFSRVLKKIGSLTASKVPCQFLWLSDYLPLGIKNKLMEFNPDFFLKSAVLLHRNLFQVGIEILPDLVVIDGFWGMEGDGPVYGRKKKVEVAIASTDAVKADGIGARIMGFDPDKIAYLRLLAQRDKGELSLNNLVGNNVDQSAFEFKTHRHHHFQQQASQYALKCDKI